MVSKALHHVGTSPIFCRQLRPPAALRSSAPLRSVRSCRGLGSQLRLGFKQSSKILSLQFTLRVQHQLANGKDVIQIKCSLAALQFFDHSRFRACDAIGGFRP